MRYESPVTALLESAAHGVESAWRELVERYAPLVSTVCGRHGLSGADAEDVSGEVWLQLVSKLHTIRTPEALPGWLTTTTRHECLTLLRRKQRQLPSDHEIAADADPEAETSLLARERRDAVRQALARLPERERKLLSMLFSDPPAPYTAISSALGMPVGAIGPTRQRCLARMRRSPALTALLLDERPVHSTCPAEFRRGRPRPATTPVRPGPNAGPHLHSQGGCDA
jgi:RNA polymerase sigma factor (sigma-70 family)